MAMAVAPQLDGTGTYTVEQFKLDLAEPYAWPGGYERHFICDDGEPLSYEAARENMELIIDSIETNTRDGWLVVGTDVNWEEPDMVCAHTGKPIRSQHGEDVVAEHHRPET